MKAHIANIVEKIGQQTRTQAAIVSALAHDALCADRACTLAGERPARFRPTLRTVHITNMNSRSTNEFRPSS